MINFKNNFDKLFLSPSGLTVMTLACRAGNPGSTPGLGVFTVNWL